MVPPEALVEAVEDTRTVTVRVGEIPILARVGGDGRVRVERLVTTDPAHYLDPALAPGSDITDRVAADPALGGSLRLPAVVDGPVRA